MSRGDTGEENQSLAGWVHVVPEVGLGTTTPSNLFFCSSKLCFVQSPSEPRALLPHPWELRTKFYMAVNIDALRKTQDSKSSCNPPYWRRIMWRNDQGCLKSCRAFFHCVMWDIFFVICSVCVESVFVVYKLVERLQSPINSKWVAAGSTFLLRLCLLNNVPSRLIMNNISLRPIVPLTFLHLTMIKMPSAHHLSIFSFSFYIFHHLPPPLLLSVLVSLSVALIHNSFQLNH